MRLAVAATAPLGADVLERLAATHDVAYLLTRPDRPQGRGRKVAPPPAKEAAERLGIEVRQPERLENFDPAIETVVVAAYGVLIPEDALDRALWLNVHPSLLPRWRGAAPIERALMAGDDETGVTIIELVPELDAGPIAAQRAFPLTPEDDFGSVSARVGELAAELLEEALPEPTLRPQADDGVTYAEKITPEDRELDWSRPPQELVNRIRALSPHIGARAQLHGRPVTIWRARVDGDELVPLEVQPDGGKRMEYEAFLRGLRSQRRFRQRLLQQLGRQFACPRRDRAEIVLRRERERPLRRDRPGVELRHELDDRHSGLLVAGHQRTLDRRGASPAREQRRVDVQPQRPVENRLGDQHAVGGHDHGPGLRLEVVEPLGLAHVDPEPLGSHLRRRRRQFAPASLWPVGAGQQVGDVVLGCQALEHVGAERGGRRDRQLH